MVGAAIVARMIICKLARLGLAAERWEPYSRPAAPIFSM